MAPILIQGDAVLAWPLVVQDWGDILRALVLPLFVWTAWKDIKTRRVPNWIWKPPLVLGLALFAWDAYRAFGAGGYTLQLFLVPSAISVLVLIPLAMGFYRMGGFGGADMKALVVIAILFPTYPSYIVPHSTLTFPIVQSPVNAFAMTVLTNGVLLGVAYPLTLVGRNLLTRSIPAELWVAFVGRSVRREDIPKTHGRLLETEAGFQRTGLDLDALRMYLAWRDTTLATLAADPGRTRDPASLPENSHRVGDGAVASGDPPTRGHDGDEDDELTNTDEIEATRTSRTTGSTAAEIEDPWGAEAFLSDIQGSAYGTTPALLREGLDVLTQRDRVWVSPGIPFLVPLVVGLVIAFVYGDLLVALLQGLGLGPAV